MKSLLLLLLAPSLFISGCSAITTGGAEITGLSLLNDRRSRDAILADEAIEDNAGAKLNAYYDLPDKCHFNITAYNAAVLVTGETPKDDCMDAGGTTPGMGEVEQRMERLPRAMHGAIAEEFRSRIIDIVRVIPNVKLVHNKLAIAQPSPFNFRANDTLITGRVKTALTQIPGFDASWVKVITEKSTVYLMGLVHRNEGAAAIDAARHHKFAWSKFAFTQRVHGRDCHA